MRVDLELRDRSNVGRRLRRLADKDPRQSYPVIGETLVELTKETFTQQRDPYGNPWQRLSPVTVAMRAKRGRRGTPRILQDSRRLYNSISAQERRGTLSVGTNVIYAATQQFGRDTNRMFGRGRAPIPARPFLPWRDPDRGPELPDSWMEEVVAVLEALYDTDR